MIPRFVLGGNGNRLTIIDYPSWKWSSSPIQRNPLWSPLPNVQLYCRKLYVSEWIKFCWHTHVSKQNEEHNKPNDFRSKTCQQNEGQTNSQIKGPLYKWTERGFIGVRNGHNKEILPAASRSLIDTNDMAPRSFRTLT